MVSQMLQGFTENLGSWLAPQNLSTQHHGWPSPWYDDDDDDDASTCGGSLILVQLEERFLNAKMSEVPYRVHRDARY